MNWNNRSNDFSVQFLAKFYVATFLRNKEKPERSGQNSNNFPSRKGFCHGLKGPVRLPKERVRAVQAIASHEAGPRRKVRLLLSNSPWPRQLCALGSPR